VNLVRSPFACGIVFGTISLVMTDRLPQSATAYAGTADRGGLFKRKQHIDIPVFICYDIDWRKVALSVSLRRTTIFLTEDQLEKLRQLAFIRRTSMSQLIREAAMEVIEDEEDIREGLRALANAEGTVAWKDYQRRRKERKRQS
jgi:hypothetical protein